jgi:chromosome segregation ATPase
VHIEMLWVIPIVSFVIFIGIVFYFAQKKTLNSELKSEVLKFNSGKISRMPHTPSDVKLQELEKAISAVTDSINNQQNVIDDFKREKIDCTVEINDLKEKLRELYKEYDIVVSENYSLRAKLKKLNENKNEQGIELPEQEPKIMTNDVSKVTDVNDVEVTQGKVNLKLYEDTRLLNVATLNDNFQRTNVNF